MGWNSWNHFAGALTDADVRAAADAIVSSGMKDAGYLYANIDDTWQGERDVNGIIHPNSRFPDMKALADYIHARGLKFGIYSSPGPKTCGGFVGSYGHEQEDARTYASWGVDYLKYDVCSFKSLAKKESHGDDKAANAMMQQAYLKMHLAIVATGRTMIYSLCEYGNPEVWHWGTKVGGNLWRTADDIRDNYMSMSQVGFLQAGLAKFAGPGHWNDPDMLEVGNGHMTRDEYRTQMSLWTILAAPLIAGNDLTKMTPETKSILMNSEVIAIDQDQLGMQGDRISTEGPKEIWARKLSGRSMAVGLFNRSISPLNVTVQTTSLGLRGEIHARDIWAAQDLGTLHGSYTAEVPAHGVVLLKLTRR
jgi:alpha-galactosidase